MAHRNRWFTLLKNGGSFYGELLVITRWHLIYWDVEITRNDTPGAGGRSGRAIQVIHGRVTGFNALRLQAVSRTCADLPLAQQELDEECHRLRGGATETWNLELVQRDFDGVFITRFGALLIAVDRASVVWGYRIKAPFGVSKYCP